MDENEIFCKILEAVMELHRTLGPGLLESVYKAALAFDLRELGMEVKTQVPIPLVYKGIKQDVGYRLDVLVENKVILR